MTMFPKLMGQILTKHRKWEEFKMKAMTKKLLMLVLLLSVVCGGGLSISKQASAKAVSKVTKKITLTDKKGFVVHKLSIATKEKVNVKIKFLEVKGKAKGSEEELYFGGYECKNGKGSLFAPWTSPSKLKKNSFKKGTILTSTEDYLNGKATVEWYIPEGIKKLKMQVTYYTESGKAGIKSIRNC